MILHNCLSGFAARLALWEEQREASTPCCRRQAQLVRWLAKFVSALLVSVTRPLLITSSIFFDRVFNFQSAHTSWLHAPERAGRRSNMCEQEVFPTKVLSTNGPASVLRVHTAIYWDGVVCYLYF